jgi:TolB-like protein/class 3 adenylate cyclase
MAVERAQRRLAAILAADVVGYARLMEANESDTFARLRAHRKELFEPEIKKHNGRIFKLTGDGLLAEFGSVVDAVECAVVLQRGLAARNEDVAGDRRIDTRMGVTLGDIILDEEDCYGEGVNIAARLQQLAPPGGICVSQTVVDHLGNKLPLDLADLGDHQVKNLAKPVHAWQVRLDGSPAHRRTSAARRRPWLVAASIAVAAIAAGTAWWGLYPRDGAVPAGTTQRPLSLAAAPSIAVLPFANMSGDPALDYFAEGVTETLTDGLSRSPAIRVIARTSAAVYKGRAIDVRQIGRELDAHFILEGSVQKGADEVRIVAQLIDTATGDHVWSDRYDGEAADALALQDEVAEKVIGSVGGNHGLIRKQEYEEAWGKDQASLEEYDYFLRGQQLFTRFTKEDTLRALAVWQEGLARNPGSGLLLIVVGWAHFQLVYGGWSEESAADLQKAFELVERGLATRPLPPIGKYSGHLLRAWLQVYYKMDWDQAWRERDIVLALNPNDASTIASMAELAIQSGRPDEAIASLSREGISWDTSYIFSSPHVRLGMAYFMKGEYQTALAHLEREPNPDPLYTLTFLAATYAELGRLEEARATVQKILAGNADATLALVRSVWPFRHAADGERLISALRKAGLPEG